MNTKAKIIDYLQVNPVSKPGVLADAIGVSRQMLHRYLRSMVTNGLVLREGQPPQTFYRLREDDDFADCDLVDEVIEKNYLYIDSVGNRFDGVVGFSKWCQERGLLIPDCVDKYKEILAKYNALRDVNGLIPGLDKFKTTFKEVNLDSVYYIDFYSYEIFGKTKLGQLLLYAKQSQNQDLIKEVSDYCKPYITSLIKSIGADAMAFVPPTVKRERQFMKLFERNLGLTLPVIDLQKIKRPILIPQKTLSKLPDRIKNARETFAVQENREFKQVLLIDDAVGSGATLNELAGMLKARCITEKVTGMSITGSAKGFEVISEV